MQLIDSERLEILRMLAEDDTEFLNTVIDAYLPQLENCIRDLRAALEANDAEGLVRLAHSLKGSSSNLGAEAVGAICFEIESGVRGGSLDGMGELIDRLEPLARQTFDYFVAEKTT